MATLTETIAEELLDSLDDPDGIERVMTQHRGSKGPLYGGLARATMWLHQHVQELNDRAGRLKADNEILGEKVDALAQKRSMVEDEVAGLDARVDQASDRLKEIEQLISRADELQALGFGQTELKTMSETLAGIGSDPTKAVATFLAAVQVIVYAGAVVILFLFVIMLLGVDRAEDLGVEPIVGQRPVAAVVGASLLGMLLIALLVSVDGPTGAHAANAPLGDAADRPGRGLRSRAGPDSGADRG